LPAFINGGNFTSMPNQFKFGHVIAYSFANDLLADGSLASIDAFTA
jgi:hypothetical protein